jgi:hypothetical protein
VFTRWHIQACVKNIRLRKLPEIEPSTPRPGVFTTAEYPSTCSAPPAPTRIQSCSIEDFLVLP